MEPLSPPVKAFAFLDILGMPEDVFQIILSLLDGACATRLGLGHRSLLNYIDTNDRFWINLWDRGPYLLAPWRKKQGMKKRHFAALHSAMCRIQRDDFRGFVPIQFDAHLYPRSSINQEGSLISCTHVEVIAHSSYDIDRPRLTSYIDISEFPELEIVRSNLPSKKTEQVVVGDKYTASLGRNTNLTAKVINAKDVLSRGNTNDPADEVQLDPKVPRIGNLVVLLMRKPNLHAEYPLIAYYGSDNQNNWYLWIFNVELRRPFASEPLLVPMPDGVSASTPDISFFKEYILLYQHSVSYMALYQLETVEGKHEHYRLITSGRIPEITGSDKWSYVRKFVMTITSTDLLVFYRSKSRDNDKLLTIPLTQLGTEIITTLLEKADNDAIVIPHADSTYSLTISANPTLALVGTSSYAYVIDLLRRNICTVIKTHMASHFWVVDSGLILVGAPHNLSAIDLFSTQTGTLPSELSFYAVEHGQMRPAIELTCPMGGFRRAMQRIFAGNRDAAQVIVEWFIDRSDRDYNIIVFRRALKSHSGIGSGGIGHAASDMVTKIDAMAENGCGFSLVSVENFVRSQSKTETRPSHSRSRHQQQQQPISAESQGSAVADSQSTAEIIEPRAIFLRVKASIFPPDGAQATLAYAPWSLEAAHACMPFIKLANK